MSCQLQLIQAGPEHQPVLANLLELYIHDFSEIVPNDVGDDGRFGYGNLSLYMSDPQRLAFLAQVDGKWAGFALVQRGSVNQPCDMTEFFVLRRYRRQGVGIELAASIWRRHPGPWQIRVRANNTAARAFWATGIEKFTGQAAPSIHAEIDGVAWHVYSFDSKG
jgi:predicted acetyltransferase